MIFNGFKHYKTISIKKNRLISVKSELYYASKHVNPTPLNIFSKSYLNYKKLTKSHLKS